MIASSRRPGAKPRRTIASFASDWYADAGAAFVAGTGLSGMTTGIKALDRVLGGLRRKKLYVIGAATSMGKSGMATCIALNVAHALEAGDPMLPGGVVGLVSMEMKGRELAGRAACMNAGIPVHRPDKGETTIEDMQALATAVQDLKPLKLYIDETSAHDIDSVVAWARDMKAGEGLDLLILDYLQYLDSRKGESSRVDAVTAMVKGLKALADELDIAVVILSQLSRDVEKREDKRPRNGDLSDASAVEKTADCVMFIYREHYYLRSREPEPGSDAHARWKTSVDRCIGRADIIVDKHRGGPTGVVRLRFDDELTRFRDPDENDPT